MSEEKPSEKALQDHQMRTAFMNQFNQFYSQLADFILKLPLAPRLKDFCLMNLDQGSFWAREGIATMQFNFPEPAPANENVAEDKSSEVPAQENQEVKEAVAVSDEAKTEATPEADAA